MMVRQAVPVTVGGFLLVEGRRQNMSKAEKQAVFPTHSAPIPGKFLNNVCVSSLNELQKSFFPEKRQKEDTPLLNLQAGVK